MKSNFIVIEGLEGAGKTTARDCLVEVLKHHGVSEVIFTREPGGTPLAEKLRTIVKHGIEGEPLTASAELMLLYAARVQLVENVIKPALNRGVWVIGDRHDLSSQAYQGGGRGLDKELMQYLRQAVLGDFKPDLTLYLDVTPEIGLQRAGARGELDRIEHESLTFFQRTRDRYLSLAKEDNSIITIDACQSLAQVKQAIYLAVSTWLQDQR